MSPYGSDHNFILTSRMAGVWPLRILVAQQLRPAFPADCPHRSHFHSDRQTRVAPDSRVFQHMASFAPRNCSRGGQSPGKRAWVVTLGPFVNCYSQLMDSAGGSDISAELSTSPWRPDYIIAMDTSRLACSL